LVEVSGLALNRIEDGFLPGAPRWEKKEPKKMRLTCYHRRGKRKGKERPQPGGGFGTDRVESIEHRNGVPPDR
jgi:hypothetical protein